MAAKLTASERRARDTNLDWLAWGEQFGWRLYGANYEYSATFLIGPEFCETFNVTLQARTDIDAAISAGKGGLK